MKIGFSTVGCPDWTFGDILSTAKDLQYDGIELRGIGKDLYLPDAEPFKPDNLQKTKEKLDRVGLEISCLASDCTLHLNDRDYVSMTQSYIELARSLGVPCIRVLGDSWGYPGENVDTGLVEKRLMELAPLAQAAGVTLLVETNGVYAETENLRALLERVACPNVMALWDINHPVRYFGESIEETWSHIGPYVRHVHLKDSRMEAGNLKYKMLGYGDLPVRQAIKTLKAAGFDGYLSFEWTKRWDNELEDAGVVFSHYAYIVKKFWEEARAG